jgi:hypothetical protein
MIERVISGGQTGADQAGWRAAKAAGIACGGYMPLDFMTEAGPRPEFAELYGAKEWPELCLTLAEQYRARTEANVMGADWVFWFGANNSRGGRATFRAVERHGPGWLAIEKPDGLLPEQAVYVLARQEVKVLMIAGNRESKAPGIGEWVERYLTEVFRLLKESQ